MYFGLSLMVIGGFCALAIEFTYVYVVRQQLRGVSDAAGHAAILKLNGSQEGLIDARIAAVAVVEGLAVNGRTFSLPPEKVEFGYIDRDKQWVSSDVAREVTSVRVLLEEEVGLGFGQTFFGRTMTVRTCGAIGAGDGNANTGEEDGPGLANGHFDWDTALASVRCAGSNRCSGTDKHTHQYDDNYDVTAVDMFNMLGGHTSINQIGLSTPFKIRVVNANLSPGVWLTINGVDYDVTTWDNQSMSELPVFSMNGSTGNMLWEFWVNYDVNAIANCNLHPTVTKDVRNNTPGPFGEWRSGAITVQLVAPGSSPTFATSAGDHQAVISQSDGLLWENTSFWHWDGPGYTASNYASWKDLYDGLECFKPSFIDSLAMGGVCP